MDKYGRLSILSLHSFQNHCQPNLPFINSQSLPSSTLKFTSTMQPRSLILLLAPLAHSFALPQALYSQLAPSCTGNTSYTTSTYSSSLIQSRIATGVVQVPTSTTTEWGVTRSSTGVEAREIVVTSTTTTTSVKTWEELTCRTATSNIESTTTCTEFTTLPVVGTMTLPVCQ